MLIEWAHSAYEDLEAITAYWKHIEDAAFATDMVQRIMQASERLVDFPLSGRTGFRAGEREIMVKGLPYILYYQVSEEKLSIARVVHMSRDFPQ